MPSPRGALFTVLRRDHQASHSQRGGARSSAASSERRNQDDHRGLPDPVPEVSFGILTVSSVTFAMRKQLQAEHGKADLEKKNISVKYDNRDTHKPGWKFAEYELKGVPVRISIGPRDLENQSVEVARRDPGLLRRAQLERVRNGTRPAPARRRKLPGRGQEIPLRFHRPAFLPRAA